MRDMKPAKRIDWDALWKENNIERNESEELVFWDGFAPHFRKKTRQEDPYIDLFYEYSAFEPGETIFDMGCASGTLAIPYAKKGHKVWAADFSPQMLKYLMQNAEEEGVADRIHPILLDWNEDWEARTDLPLCDVAISSRSFMPHSLGQAIRNLEMTARRRVCIGAWDLPTRHYDRYVAAAIGYERPGYSCYVYIMNELMDRDLLPELRFIYSPFRLVRYESPDQALEEQTRAFQYGLTEEQTQRLAGYCRDHLVLRADGEKQYWIFDHSDMATIAHISWNMR